MLKKEIQIGGIYIATVSNNRVHIRILRLCEYSKGWVAQNLSTGREVRIVTAGRLSPSREIQSITGD